MRIRISNHHVRILYFFIADNRIVLTHVLHKTTDRVPVKEINKAKGIRDRY
ncbi:type II toxin-antitoxin system RelE/ParE family toxin [Oceanispirochaeta sp.]|uniref:type II toxin-antitoxin system RelE/ParE family toxin n=1 Tax=Oceanispirochaeta sp. TaxID=2035350 RepID=UPI00345D1399